MKFEIHVHHHKAGADLRRLLHPLVLQGNLIMQTQNELAADLAVVTEAVAKIGAETVVTLQKVTDLEAALASGGMTSPEVDAALQALKAQVQVVDDLIPDAV